MSDRRGHARALTKTRRTPQAPAKLRPGTGLEYIKFWRERAGDGCVPFPFKTSTGKFCAVNYLGTKYSNPARLACLLANGAPKSPDAQALHVCGNGHIGCINPHHLRWGNPKDNAEDRVEHQVCGKREEPSDIDRKRQMSQFKGYVTKVEHGGEPETSRDVLDGQRSRWRRRSERVVRTW